MEIFLQKKESVIGGEESPEKAGGCGGKNLQPEKQAVFLQRCTKCQVKGDHNEGGYKGV